MQNDDESKFPDEIRAAFDGYPQPRPSPEFEARFWSRFDARRGRYRGFGGFLRRLVEVEIEGVAVWRLALSTVSGGAVCALVFGAFAWSTEATNAPQATFAPLVPAVPETPRLALDAPRFYARELEDVEDVGATARFKSVPRRSKNLPEGGEISCVGFKNRWV